MRTRDSVSDAYSAEQVLTKCLLLALFFFHLFRTYYFPERLRWIHLGYRALRDSPCAREAHSPAGVADTEQRPSPEEPPRAKRRLASASPRVLQTRPDAEPATTSGSGGESAQEKLRCPRAPRVRLSWSRAAKPGWACRVSRHKPSGLRL